MSKIGTLVTGAGVQTSIAGLSQCQQFIVIGDVDTANPLQGLQVEIDGNTYINLQTAALITAYTKWQMQAVSGSAVVGLMIKATTGRIKKNTTYRFTNAGATTPDIYAFSTNDNGVPFVVASKTILATSYDDFSKFSALFIETPANIQNLEVVFADGSKDTLTIQEASALFTLQNQSEANGYLGTVLVVDNRDQKYQQIRVNTNATGSCAVAIAKIPDAAWKVLQGNAG